MIAWERALERFDVLGERASTVGCGVRGLTAAT